MQSVQLEIRRLCDAGNELTKQLLTLRGKIDERKVYLESKVAPVRDLSTKLDSKQSELAEMITTVERAAKLHAENKPVK